MADDCGLNVLENISNTNDGAHTMVEAHSSLGQKIKAINDSHEHALFLAHQAALSAADGSDGVVEISETEARLLAVWKYYHRLRKLYHNLNECRRILRTKGLRFKVQGKTRWLSGQTVGIAL